ncbi:14039_t:CDS:2 [Acaulospora morrowiae]|uniref:Ribosome biogenesis protein NOP53 n=1 Tax=Acaulospora morrowiae TaxID=94023 RepID=A0A9N8V8Y9_9GLOM|nr:14039_t:CDS:2 [Acaulospora morrowiae]
MLTLNTKKSTKPKPSRKGKKAWRKNVDITEIEETLEEIRTEERVLGGKIRELPSEELFVIDTKGDAKVQRKLNKRLAKLHVDQVLESRSKLPPVFSKPLKQKYEKKQMSQFTKISLDKLMQEKHDTPGEVTSKSGEYDVWMQEDEGSEEDWHPQKKRKIKMPTTLNMKPAADVPAVRIPHPGTSYMPEDQAHQELLMIAHKEEEAKLLRLQRIKSQLSSHTKEASSFEDTVNGDEDENSDSEENEGNEIEVEQEYNEHEKKLIEKKKLTEEEAKLPKNKIGKYRVRKIPTDVLLSDELKPTFREFKPEGNLFRERMASYEERNIVEPRVRIKYVILLL